MRTSTLLAAALGMLFTASVARGQDPVQVDPKHTKVELENDQVRRAAVSPRSERNESPALWRFGPVFMRF